MTSRREVLKTSSYLIIARLFTRLASVPFLLYVAATLGPSLFGVLSFVIASVEMLASLSDLGLSRYGARAIVRAKDGKERLAGMIVIFQVVTSIVLILAALILIVLAKPEPTKAQMGMLGLVAILLSSFIFSTETIFTGMQRLGASALLTIAGKSVYLVLGFAVLLSGYSVVALMAAYVIGMAVESLLRMIYTVLRVIPISFRFSFQELITVARGTMPFAVTAVAILVFYRADVIVMGLLRSDSDVGIYSAAYSFFSFLMWLPIVLSRSLLPSLTAKREQAPADAEQTSWFWYRAVAICSIPISFTLTVLARPLFETLMPAYEESILVLQVLIWAIPPLTMISLGFIALTVNDLEKKGSRTTVVAALLVVLLDVIFIRLLGPLGASIAMVATLLVWVAMMHWLLRKDVFVPKHGVVLTFALPLSGTLAMALTALLTISYGNAVSLAAGLSVYAVVVLSGRQLERRLLLPVKA